MTNPNDSLREEYIIETPENVTFGYDVAGIGSRFIGALIDTSIIFFLLALIDFALFVAVIAFGGERIFEDGLEAEMGWVAGFLIAFFVVLQFVVFWGYYMVFEWVWNGQTPGKRMAKTRVVRSDGDPPGFGEVAVRNLVRIVDFLPTAYAIGLATMFCNRQSRRLGDFAAGTLVVRERSYLPLGQLARSVQSFSHVRAVASTSTVGEVSEGGEFPALHHMAPADYELVRDALTRSERGVLSPELARRLVLAIAARVGVPPPANDYHFNMRFLQRIESAYRQQQ